MPQMELPNLADLVSAESRVFEVAARKLADHAQRAEKREILVGAVRAIDGALSLGAREKDRRIQQLIERLSPSADDLAELARVAIEEAFASKNAIMLCLPPQQRQSIYPTVNAPRGLITGEASEPPAQVPARTGANPVAGQDDVDDKSEVRAVLLLGSDEEHAANLAILRKHRLTPLRCETNERLDELLRTPVCGIVVGGTWWRQFAPGNQETALKRICSISSLLWLRIDLDNLDGAVAGKLASMQRDICFAERSSSVFCYASGCKLTDADIAALLSVAGLLDASCATQFHPAELTHEESMLLRAAATKHVRGHRSDAEARLELLRTSLFANGRSLAKIAFVHPDDGGAPFVVKLGTLGGLQDEMKRFRHFIDRWDGRTHPELHFHGNVGAIVFSLIDAAGTPGTPAPPLSERLEKLLNAELGSWGEEPPDEANIAKAIERTVGKLLSLNANHQQEKCNNYGWMGDSVSKIAAKVAWTIEDGDGVTINLVDLAKCSAEMVQKLDGVATSHGDVHLDNVLVSDDRDPYLIDFAITGAGHPCFDLVRLNAAIKYRAMRMVGSECRIAEFVRATHVLGRTYAEVEKEFPDLLTSAGNRVSARASIAVRSACLKLLDAYGGKLADYLAMEALVACHALTMIQPQAGLVRASIRALASEVMAVAQGTAT